MSKRPKNNDTESLTRWPSRTGGASIISHFILDRTKTGRQRFARYMRFAPRYLKPQQTEFRIRTSVADLIMKELDLYNRCIFYQRVYILTRNALLRVTAQSSTESILKRYLQSKTSLTAEGRTEALNEEENHFDNEAEELFPQMEAEADELSQIQLRSEADGTDQESPIVEGKVFTGAIQTKTDVAKTENCFQELDFFEQFKEKVEEMVKAIDAEQLSDDQFTGLFLCMGNSHSLIVLEGTEDAIAYFCQELLSISDEYLEAMRVVMIDDRIEETYFDEFLYRRSVAMNINEKLPPPTANDPYLMSQQHSIIKEKLQALTKTLSQQLRPQFETGFIDEQPQPTIVIIEEEKQKKTFRKRKRSRAKKKEEVQIKEEDTPVATPADNRRSGSMLSEARHSIISSIKRMSIPYIEAADEGGNTAGDGDAASTIDEREAPMAPPASILEETGKTEDYKMSLTTLLDEKKINENEDDEDIEPKEVLSLISLHPATFNRLLPEVQRIELVLTSKRFYFDVSDFVRFSHEIPMHEDEDALIWPTTCNYLPLNVFQRMTCDVNLTFGSYETKDGLYDDSTSSDGEESSEEEEDKNEEENF